MRLSRRQFIGLLGAFGLTSCAKMEKVVPDIGFGGEDTFTFATINDLHVSDLKSVGIVNRAVSSINADERIRFTVVLGDIATDGKLTELKLARTALDRLEKPCFAVPGNHDVLTSAKDIFCNYTQTFGDVDWVETQEGWAFIGLDSCEGAGSDVSVQPARLDWLAKRLDHIKPGRPIVLFVHHPFNPNTKAYRVKNADEVEAVFSGHNLRLVAAGHYHGNQVEERNGILYTTTACCSSTRDNFDGTAEKGYRLFHIKGDAIETEFVEVKA